MAPWNAQQRWFWVAAVCLVGGLSTCWRTDLHLDESPNNAAARRQLPAQVVRRRADLPKRERPSIVKESVRPGIAPLPETETGSEQNASTSALAQASFDLTSFETDRFDDSVPISVWLSGEIEPVTE